MPPKTVRKCVERALDNLSATKLDRFRNELVKRKQEPRIALNRVEGKRSWEVVGEMISTFKEDGALEVTKELLEELEFTEDAETMLKEAMEAGYRPPPPAGGAAGAPAAGAQAAEEHFVDRHMDVLIQRGTGIDAILDALLKEKVLSPEIYDDIRSQRTSQAKMRELYSGPLRAAEEVKDIFYRILKAQQPLLVQSLEKK
ncbi:apoptosis-associated speck-like protein containing a CARD isoform 1-T1 [Odontesthes bonariensis]|uniref:apoptosis-associated speck-like protein containing a CARD isoform X1 n=1 Tax=Odontesthes bonariensis TaxID=219752 RepID=UPI003F584662